MGEEYLHKNTVILVLAFFLAGWFSNSAISHFQDSDNSEYVPSYNLEQVQTESGDSEEKNLSERLFDKIGQLMNEKSDEERDKDSPHDWIKMDEILVYHDKVIINIDNPEWALFTDTKSMDPVIDSYANAIEIIPKSESDIHVGDIVAYKSKYADGTITHRVIEISEDSKGWYAILKGDNNEKPDPGKVRFDQIKRVVVGILY